MKLFRYILLFLIVASSAMVISYAAGNSITVIPPPGNVALPTINTQSSGDAIGAIIAWFIWLTAVLTVIAITWWGIQMILASGEEEKFKKARYTMIYAFIGLIVAGLAYGAVTFITNLNLDNFII